MGESDDDARLIDFYPYRSRFRTYRRLEPEGRDRQSILDELSAMASEEDRIADRGRVSGSIYHGDHDHYGFLTEAFSLFAHANVLQRDMYPSATKLEAEIVAMTAALLHGDDACGVVTFGGTESLINPVLAYRDRARAEKGITEPEMIVPVTAHVALDKAAHLLGVQLIKAPLGDDWRADAAWIRGHVTDNTLHKSLPTLFSEGDDPILYRIQPPPIHMYPKNFKVAEAHFDFITGVGLNSGDDDDDDPEVVFDYSKDGGDSWAASRRVAIGAQAQRKTRVKVRSLGRFDHNGVTFRLTCSANVVRGLQQMAIRATPLRT